MCHIAKQVFREAVKTVLNEEAFKLPSTEARVALETAIKVTEWMDDATPQKEVIYENFINQLFLSLLTCFSDKSSLKEQKEHMWKSYHHLRISPNFKSTWHCFLSNITTTTPSPAFFQHVTDLCFKEFIKIKFPTQPNTISIANEFHLTFEEANALRYAAGYICYKLQKQLEASKNPRKSELLSLITNLVDNEETDENTAEDWVNIIDRGGLCHISEHAYMLFAAMEEELQFNIKNTPDEKMTDGFKTQLLAKINSNKCVKSYWSNIVDEADEDDASTILDMITRLWITIRGYAYCSAWVEHHKQACQRGIQKSKALRKTL